jgi:hypothetical protein
MLEARAHHPSCGWAVSLVAGVIVGLDAGREIVPVVDQRISPPAIAVPKQRPGIADADRTLCITAHAQLEAPGRIRLEIYGAAYPLPFEEVPVIALQEER